MEEFEKAVIFVTEFEQIDILTSSGPVTTYSVEYEEDEVQIYR